MAVSSIKFRIDADTKQVTSALSEAQKEMNQAAKSMQQGGEQMSRSMGKASGSVKEVSSSVKSGNGVIKSMVNSLKGVGSAALGAVSKIGKMALSITVFKAVNSTINTLRDSITSAFDRADALFTFDKAMTRITGSSEEAAAVLKQVNDVVTGTPYGLDVAAKAVTGFANSGLAVQDSVKYMKAWADAVAAYGDGSSDTLRGVTYQLGQMSSKGKVNLEDLNVVMEAGIPAVKIYADAVGRSVADVQQDISDGKISAEDFMKTMYDAFESGGNAFKSVADSAKQAGGTWKGTMDNMKAAVTRGMLGVINAIDSALVANGLPTIKEAITAYGVTIETGLKDLSAKVGPVIDTIVKFFKDSGPAINSAWDILKDLGSTVFGALVDTFNKIAPPIEETLSTLGSFISEHMDDIKNIIDTASQIISGSFQAICDVIQDLEPYASSLMDTLSGLADSLNDLLPPGKELSDIVREWAGPALKAYLAYKTLSGGVKIAKGAFSAFIKVLDGVGTVKTFFAALKGGNRAFAKLGTAGKIGVKALQGVGKAGKAMGSVIKAGASVALSGLKAMFGFLIANPIVAVILAVIATIALLWFKCEWFRDGVKAVWEAIKNAFSTAVEAVGQAMTDMGNWIKNTWESIKQWFSDAGQAISETWNSIVEGAKAFGTMVWNVIQVVFMTIWSIISGIFTIIVSGIRVFLDGIRYTFEIIWATICNVVSAAWTAIWGVIEPVVTAIGEFLSAAWTAISEFFVGLWEGIKNVFSTAWEAISTAVSTAVTAISEWLTTAWNVISSVTSTVWNAIVSVLTTVWNTITEAAGAAWAVITGVVSQCWDAISSVVTTVGSAIGSFLSGLWESIKSYANSVWEGIKANISNVWNGIKNVVSTVGNAVKSTVSNIWDGIKSATKTAWDGIKNAIATPINAAKDLVGKAIDGIKGFFSNLKIKFPDIKPPKLPHFSLEGSFSLMPPSVPHLSVDWYKTGGIATGPSIVGIGEAGDEAILPLSNKSKMKPFASAVANFMDKKAPAPQASPVAYMKDNSQTEEQLQPLQINLEAAVEMDKRLVGKLVAESVRIENNKVETRKLRKAGVTN